VTSRRVVLATGGQSLPKSGSDGSGYGLASALGHAVVLTTPALVPLVLDDREPALHRQLSGVSADVELVLRLESRVASRVRGAMLFTHFGISGPATLDISREWARAALERRDARLSASFIPGERLETLEPRWLALGRERPGTSVRSVLATSLPASLAQALLAAASIPTGATITQLTREARRRLIDAVLDWPLPVTGTRGYTYAETTAGGVDLSEIDPGTMASRRCPGLYLVGELLDVDGRIGGFNFQWAWASGRAAGAALARAAAQ
jgi:predicted Rossmann fold flavoprotein